MYSQRESLLWHYIVTYTALGQHHLRPLLPSSGWTLIQQGAKSCKTAVPGSGERDDICFVVHSYWSKRTAPLANHGQTSVRWSDTKIRSSLPPPPASQVVSYRIDFAQAVNGIKKSEMGKMQFLGVLAVVLAVYNVHAKVYFREEFLDGGKFGLDFFQPVSKVVGWLSFCACGIGYY